MICVNELQQQKCCNKQVLETLIVLLAPFTPHLSEELWEALGNTNTVCDAQWPTWNEEYLKEDSITYAISFNGKTRFTIDFPADASKEEIQKTALESEQSAKYIAGLNVVKVIVVPNKLVNIVVK